MNGKEYLEKTVRRTNRSDIKKVSKRLACTVEEIHSALGIGGEAGEIVDMIKKYVWYGKPFDTEKLLEETGDLLYYVANLLDQYGFTLEDAMQANTEKLNKRFPNGFSEEAAMARADKAQGE